MRGLTAYSSFPALTELDSAIKPHLRQSIGVGTAFFLLHAGYLVEKPAAPVRIPDLIGRMIDISCHNSLFLIFNERRSVRRDASFYTIARTAQPAQ